jgi:multimeric flavodoxin WrbA
MKIVFLNGNPDAGNKEFEKYLTGLTGELNKAGHTADTLTLRDMDIKYCTGCWGCWVKTPGRCVANDDSDEVCRRVINSGLTVFASPLNMGYVSPVLKKTMDKLIPLVHPYGSIFQGEVHHLKRYHAYPKLAVLLKKEDDTDDDDTVILQTLFDRLAINFHSKIVSFFYTGKPFTEAVDEINGI